MHDTPTAILERALEQMEASTASLQVARKRIAELEAALLPFANLLLHLRTEEIEPKAVFEVSRPDGDDCDLIGAEIIRARKALNK